MNVPPVLLTPFVEKGHRAALTPRAMALFVF
jgi:hypothetical protein